MPDVLGARTPVSYYSEAYSVTAADALVTVTGVNRGGTVTTTQLTVPTGRTLRVSAITVTGNLLGTTVASTQVRLRAVIGGAAVVTSPVYFSARMGNSGIGTQAANYGMEPVQTFFGEGLEFPAGSGLQFTAVATTAAMHSLTFSLIGFEYVT